MSESGFTDFRELFGRMFGEDVKAEEPKSDEEIIEARKKACERKCVSMNEQVGNLNEDDGYDCPKCKNRGYFYEPNEYLGIYDVIQKMCDCRRIRKAIRLMKRSGLEDLVKDCRFDNFKVEQPWQKSALDTAKKYVENYQEHWLFFGGATGRGKTHLCTATAIALLKKGLEVKYMLWRDESRRLKSMVNDPNYINEIEYYKSVDVLYIDDLFKTGKSYDRASQRPTEADINLAYEILSNRAIRKKPTIISSESTMLDLLDIDESICGRIKQRCGEYCVNIGEKNTKNYRLE